MNKSENIPPVPNHPDATTLPGSLKQLTLGDKKIFLLGTAHVSKKSVKEARSVIEQIRPEAVCVELDENRYQNLIDATRWRKTNIVEVIRKGKAMLLLSSLIMTSFQRRIGEKLGIMPGAELLEATRAAHDVGSRLILADRDIQVTLKRTWANLSLRDKFKMTLQLAGALFVTEEIDEKAVEELKQDEKLGDVLELLATEFPRMKSTLIDERDKYLAEKIRQTDAATVVAVVGAGHVPGILNHLHESRDLTPLETIPGTSPLGTALKWGIPALMVALFVYGFVTASAEESIDSVTIWFLTNGLLSAAGAALALGHPLTIIAAFLAAPLTSLNPMIAAGWVSGLVQAFVKKPTVEDLEDLPHAITTAKGFWMNPVSRILLVVVLSNLGSVLGTFIAGSWIAARIFG